MNALIDGMVGWSIQELQSARQNALTKLDDPKKGVQAADVLGAIEAELERRALPGMIVKFKEVYPGGFYGEVQATEERNYKVAASDLCKSLFGQKAFLAHLEKGEWVDLNKNFKLVLNATNLIQGRFEKPKILEKLAQEGVAKKYFCALYDCLWGDAELLERFDRFCDVLDALELAKWTYASYFSFLMDPEKCMFVKPDMLKRSIEISNHWLSYDSHPSGKQYGQILEFSEWLKFRIAELSPRDMIDVHSFMWHLAPTGKWSDE